RLLVGARAVLDAARHDEELALAKLHVPVAQLDRQAAAQDEEEVVRVVVAVPDELALHLDDPHVVLVDAGDHLGPPVLVEEGELLCQVDLLVHAASPLVGPTRSAPPLPPPPPAPADP